MTISASATYRTLLTADGVLVDFDFTFPLLDADDLDVYLIDDDGVATLQASGYSVAINSTGVGGTVTFITAPTDTYGVLMIPNASYSQETALPTNEGISEEQIEIALDRAVLLIRQLKDILDRCIKLSTTSSFDDLELPEPAADSIIGWNSDGTALENKVLGDLEADLSVAIASGDAEKIVRIKADESGVEAVAIESILPDLTAETAIAIGDEVVLNDVSAAAARKMTIVNLLKVLNALTADATPDGAADYLLSYDASASTVKKVLMNNLPRINGEVLQVVNSTTGAVASGTTTIPYDDTIPQNTEGDQYLSLAITPVATTNKLKIEVTLLVAASTGANAIVALFQDSTAAALAVASEYALTNEMHVISFVHYMAAGTVSATTFKVRAGLESAGTMTVNGLAAARKFGGVAASSITITEIKA